jgi:hypothetical protein
MRGQFIAERAEDWERIAEGLERLPKMITGSQARRAEPRLAGWREPPEHAVRGFAPAGAAELQRLPGRMLR